MPWQPLEMIFVTRPRKKSPPIPSFLIIKLTASRYVMGVVELRATCEYSVEPSQQRRRSVAIRFGWAVAQRSPLRSAGVRVRAACACAARTSAWLS